MTLDEDRYFVFQKISAECSGVFVNIKAKYDSMIYKDNMIQNTDGIKKK